MCIAFFTASYIKVCSRSDPEINKCVLNSIEQLRSKLKSGIPELEVPAIEPLTLKHVRLLRGPQAARLDINLTNIQVTISKFEFLYYLEYAPVSTRHERFNKKNCKYCL